MTDFALGERLARVEQQNKQIEQRLDRMEAKMDAWYQLQRAR